MWLLVCSCVARVNSRSLPPTLTSTQPPTRVWEVVRTVAAPLSIVVKCGGGGLRVVVCAVVLVVSCVSWFVSCCSCCTCTCVCVCDLFLFTHSRHESWLPACRLAFTLTRYCRYQYCMVYGIRKESRGGGGGSHSCIVRKSRAIAIVLQSCEQCRWARQYQED